VRFDQTDDLRDAEFVDVDMTGARFHNVKLDGVRMREANLVGARLSGLITGLVINDIEVAPLIQAELERRHPELAKLAPRDAAGVREAWHVVEDAWAATKARLATVTDEQLRQRVDDEWSTIETLRHLIFVTDLWFGANLLGEEHSYCEFGQVPSFITDPSQFGIDPAAQPTTDEVVSTRDQRLERVGSYVATVTDADLERSVGQASARRCLVVLFNEEWAHNRYANRDLDRLTAAD
jgi:uncharacterized protein YjbI with pentapeptide repeats